MMSHVCKALALAGIGLFWIMVATGAGAAEPSLDPYLVEDEYGNRPPGSGWMSGLERGSTGSTAGAGGAADWSALGVMGGDVFAVAVSPLDSELVLAGVAPGGDFNGTLYRSVDGGDHWSEVPQLTGNSVYAIEFAPDGTVYLGTQDAVWTSPDGGLTWTRLDLGGVTFSRVFGISIDPSDPSTLWIGIPDAQPVNLMRSTDGGQTWQDRTPPLAEPMRGKGVAIDPHDSDTVIAIFGPSFGGGAVWVTTDGGETWTDRSAGLPDNPMQDVVYDGTRLLVGGGQVFGFQFVGLYESTDLGVTWTALHDGTWEMPIVYEIAVDPNDPQTILVATDGEGVHRSTDGGATWELGIGGTGGYFGRALRFAPGSSSALYFGASSLGVFRSVDGGDVFLSSSSGINEMNLFSVTANPSDPDELAVAFQGLNNGGVLSSTNGGATWTVEPVPATRHNTVRFAADGTLYSLSEGPTNIAQEGVYRREPNGSWSAIGPDQGDPGIFQSDLSTLYLDAEDPQFMLTGGRDSLPLGGRAAVWRTTNGGETWERVYESDPGTSFFVTDIEVAGSGTEQVMIAAFSSTANQGGVVRSTDQGATWSVSSDGLPVGFLRDPRLCVSAGDPPVFYLAFLPAFSSSSLYASDDGGLTWEATGWTASGTSGALACDPVMPDVLYHARQGGSFVARSADGGATFEPFGDGLEAVNTPRELAFAGPDRLLLATRKGGYANNPEAGPGELAMAPVEHDFGEVEIGTSVILDISVTNTAAAWDEALSLSAISLTGDAAYTVTGGDCAPGMLLGPHHVCTVTVTFSPDGEEIFDGQLTVASDDGQSVMADLAGAGIQPPKLPDELFGDRFEH